MTRTWVVPRCRRRIHAELGHQPGAHVIVVEVATHAELRQLHFLRTEKFTGPAYGVVCRMVEVVDVNSVSTDFPA